MDRRCVVLIASVGFTVAGATLVAARLGGARGVGRVRAFPSQRVGRMRAVTKLDQAYLLPRLTGLIVYTVVPCGYNVGDY